MEKDKIIPAIFTGLFIIATLLIVYFCYGIISAGLSSLLSSILSKQKIKVIFGLSGLSIVLPLAFLFIKELYLKRTSKENKFHKEVEKINTWFVFTIYFMLLVFMVGTIIINYHFQENLPFKQNFEEYPKLKDEIGENLKETPFLVCYSTTGKKDFVLNDKIHCDINIKYKKDSNYYYKGYSLSNLNTKEKDSMSLSNKIPEEYYPIRDLYLSKKGQHEYAVQLEFGEKDIEENRLWFGLFKEFSVLTSEEYNSKENLKLPFIIGLITLIIATIPLAMKNLKDIWDNK